MAQDTLAIILTGAKQYPVAKGDTITVEKLDKGEGKKVEFSKVLLVAKDTDIQVGRPFLKGVKVTGKVVQQVKGPKLVVFRHRPRENWRTKTGHRQKLTEVIIEDIVTG